MELQDFEIAHDPFSCIVPHGKRVFSIPMDILAAAPKLAKRLGGVPDAVYLAKVDSFCDGTVNGSFERYLLKFGKVVIEGHGKPGTMGSVGWDAQNILICFTPRMATFDDQDYVVLDIIAMTPASTGKPNTYIGFPGDTDEPDWDSIGKEQQQLDREIAAFEATT